MIRVARASRIEHNSWQSQRFGFGSKHWIGCTGEPRGEQQQRPVQLRPITLLERRDCHEAKHQSEPFRMVAEILAAIV